MKCCVFGSLNIDKVYSLDHLPEKGETLSCLNYEIHIGGKGLNQAISLKKTSEEVYIAGCIGNDGIFLKDFLDKNGVDTSLLKINDSFTGSALIEVDRNGQNQMILFKGTNHEISKEYCDYVLNCFEKGDLILMQYETSCVEYMAEKAHKKGLITAINPSPYVNELDSFNYKYIDYIILNEFEGKSISKENNTGLALKKLYSMTDNGKIIMTLGADGAAYYDGKDIYSCNAFDVDVVDTTGAGDTFTGYILSSLLEGTGPDKALKISSAASAIAVGLAGAAETIPTRDKVIEFLNTH